MNRFLGLARPAWIIAAHFAVYALARAALYWAWPESFADLGAAALASAWARGFVIDASIIGVALAPVVLALALPLEFAQRPWWRSTWTWLAYGHLCVAALVLAGDVAYFGTVGRHVGPELVAFADDPALMWGIVWQSYRLPLAAMLALLVALAFAWKRLMRWDERLDASRPPAWTLAVLAPIFLVAIRGNVSGKPIGTVDAFHSGSVSAGYLALNGPFSIAHSIPNAKDLRFDFMPVERALASVREQVLDGHDRAPDPAFPLLRVRDEDGGPLRNVVLVLLESWDADVVDAIRVQRNEPPLGLTPNFDALAAQGVLFTQFYAAGQRSTHGLFAVLTGLPSLPGLPYLGNGIEQSRLSYLGQAALAEGYATHFLQGSSERSFRFDAVAALAGFERYLGKESIAEATGRPPMASWGAWDHDLFQAAHASFVDSPRPFLGLVFTTSTHLPFQVPEGHARPYPHDTEEHQFWNSIQYSDSALGEFIASARAAGYFDDTIFVFVADHRSGLGFAKLGAREKHHIPCLVVAPGLAPRVEHGVRSQLDVLPSIAELANWKAPLATFGRSLFDESEATRGALCMRSEIVIRVEQQGWVAHDLSRRLESGGDGEHVDAIEERLLASVQVIVDLLRTNRVLPVPAALAVPNPAIAVGR